MRPWLSLLSAVVVCATACAAQQPNDIAAIAARSAIILRGTVLAIANETPRAPGEIAVTRITFRVDDGIRGATTGETMTIRQWNVSADEYRIGEALVLFLYPPSEALGLTSPVGGPAGHRRVGDIPADVLEGLRTEPKSASPASTANPPQRPARPTRQGGGTR